VNGEIEAPILIIDRINSDLERVLKTQRSCATHLCSIPYKGFPSLRSKWYFEHKKWVKIIPRDAYTY
jgi:ribonuclease G